MGEGTQDALVFLGMWSSAIVPVVFAVYYSAIADWWKTATGRAIIAIDAAVWVSRLTYLVAYINDEHRSLIWVHAIAYAALPAIILYRLAAFERLRRSGRNRVKRLAELAVDSLIRDLREQDRVKNTDPPEVV